MGLFTKVFGTYSQRELKSIYPIVDKITALEEDYKKLTDAELQAKTPEFKARLTQGETLDDILPEAFATVREAADEALFALELLNGRALDLPVYYDWEPVSADDSRTAVYDGRYLTAGATAFCNIIEQGGYTAGVYLNRQQGYYRYDLRSLAGRSLWVADYADYPDFYYAYDVWQYEHQARLDGVNEIIDLNLEFRPVT